MDSPQTNQTQHHNSQQQINEEEIKRAEWFINPLQKQYLEAKLQEAVIEHAMAVYNWDQNPAIVAAANGYGRAKIAVLKELLENSMTVLPTT